MEKLSQRWVTNDDKSIVLRIVGFLEYATALKNLDMLVRLATPEELAAIDELIQERPEFTVTLNLSERLLAGPSTLIPIDAGGDNERRGLAWVMALARVELGGLLATFDVGVNPFVAVGPSRFEWNEYQDLLLDDAEVHYWSLKRDTDLERVAKSVPDVPMLAYIRRLNVGLQLLRAAAESRANELTAAQFSELSQQHEELAGLRDGLRFKVAAYVADQSSTRRRVRQQDVVAACARLLRGEQEELERGTARVEQFDLTAPAESENE